MMVVSYRILVKYKTRQGIEGSETFSNESLPVCVRRVRRKYPNCIITGTTASLITRKDKCIPDPPEGWEYASFSTAKKKDRWGRLRSTGEEL